MMVMMMMKNQRMNKSIIDKHENVSHKPQTGTFSILSNFCFFDFVNNYQLMNLFFFCFKFVVEHCILFMLFIYNQMYSCS